MWDQFTNDYSFQILAIVVHVARERLALVAGTSLSGVRVAHELDELWFRYVMPISPCASPRMKGWPPT